MATCLIVQPIHQAGIDRLHAVGIATRRASASDMATVASEVGDCAAVITRNAGFDTAAIDAARALEVIANHGVGTNRIDVAHASDLGIPIVFTPFANARSTAEHAIALMLALAKRLAHSDRAVRSGHWDYRYTPGFSELHGKVFGVVGFGTIGRIAAEIAGRGFGMRVLVFSPMALDDALAAAGAQRTGSLAQLLREADVVSLHRPARADTRHMIGAAELGMMKPGALLINTARADLVDTAALVRALDANHIAGAGLDVFDLEPLAPDSPLAALPDVILTPHTAGGTDEALEQTALQCAEQIIDVLAGRRPPCLVVPEVWERRRPVAA
ncbi:MAG: hydroxyacid dehydrogenase [Proteobacteria bacterium]|nr:hydroxyacid dehydrogenase [Burkholderiales bacterium]